MNHQTPTLVSVSRAPKLNGLPYRQLLIAVQSGRIKSVTLSKRPLVSPEGLRTLIAQATGEGAST